MMDILRSEWTKIRSVRSTVWTLAVTAALMLGFAALIGAAAKSTADGPIPGDQAVTMSLGGSMLAALSMATLGVLVISSEYRTGGIRTSFMAVPQRMRLLTGKIVVFVAISLVVCLVASAGAIGVGVAIFQPPSIELGDVVRSSLGSGLYLTACGLFGLGLGTLVRHTPGAIVSAIALILVLPMMANQLPGEWGKTVAEYFTTNAGLLVVSGQTNGSLGPWSGFAVYLAWVAVAVLAGGVLMRRRDA
ncbi:ABC transporter permease subunit [Nonomuraea sp. NEAU-A123]|uniref:ABC transporter permease subunit n=1 Tax=Nonomuraea sp. NEAU-A123 TaxID=2839649 RepID=UPI001BE4C70D|nr:ABC transporter permease subunit [Nonomuraea sp. NEAU-A123]MBT2231858.1 ABC transporter permease subunit [Nonomuraea sp. NEAU-A123]